ncbi:hypothetical protein [Massilia sp. Dwa41.01b]|uniref:hypothetical protein n=1 Tax=Massilia sp. Dwa41.01b TaxID=2709302 RepID=UPI002805FD98|nr:hypothetical protein [Massilia sp. Dwa41.01b]
MATPVRLSVRVRARRASAWRFTVSWVRTRARTTAAFTGLPMKSAAPASSARVSSSGRLKAVTKMTGRSEVSGFSRSARSTA